MLAVLATEAEEEEALLLDEDDLDDDEEEAALLDEEEDFELDTARAGVGRLLDDDEEEADAVGRPTGTPKPALIESIRLEYEVVGIGATKEGLGRLATEPPFHLATVSSPIR